MKGNLYSPIREQYHDGVTLSIDQLLRYAVTESDNIACDVLLQRIGGPLVVEDYFRKLGYNNISIRHSEATQQSEWDLQFDNWITPITSTAILFDFFENKRGLLSRETHDYLWTLLLATSTGPARLKGALPSGTKVAHKTGTSGTNENAVTAAVNDIGIVYLPNGSHFFISVFLTMSTETVAENEKVIAAIARACWDDALQQK